MNSLVLLLIRRNCGLKKMDGKSAIIGKGGLSLMKWEGIKTKMDPVLDELLGERF